MKIWLIQPGEELPIDPGTPRLLRTGILANMFVERGHEVVYWTSTFSHARKTQRFKTDTDINVRDNYKIKLVHSPGYIRNISMRRVYDHVILAKKFKKHSLHEQKPDLVLCSMPTIELSLAATNYGKIFNIPVVLDLRDMWPDIFLEAVPTWAKGIGRAIATPMFRNLKTACENATALIGITEEFLDWGLKYARRSRNDCDAVFHHGYSPVKPNEFAISRAWSFWKQRNICRGTGDFIACFFGYFGRQFEITTVLDAASKLNGSATNVRFVLCGAGDNLEQYQSMAKDLNNVVLPGFVGYPEIWTLTSMASVGLAPYISTPSFMASFPNKVGEYLSAGLPIVSSLRGCLENLLLNSYCGHTYENGNAAQLSDILIQLFHHPKNVRQLALNASKLFQEKFVAANVYGGMVKHLEFVALQHFPRH